MSDLAIVITDPTQPDNPIVYVSDGFEHVTKYARSEVLGRNCRFLQGPETQRADIQAIRDGLEKGREFETVLLNYKADGTPFLNQLLISPVENDKGEIVQFFGVQRHLAAGEAALRIDRSAKIDRHLTDRLRELQHRVKNHLAMIVGMIRIQSRRDVSLESFQAVSRRVEALALLYDELVSADKSDAETVPADAYLTRIATVISGLEGRTGVAVDVACDPVELPIDHAARLGLVMSELVTNALEHAFPEDEGGTITVRLAREDGVVVLRVADTGRGLPEGSTWPRPAKEGGAKPGVGGSIVASLADGLGATLDVRSGSGGTEIAVRLDGDPD